MPLAIELFFDADADAVVRSLWHRLSEDGSPALDGAKYQPHVSFAVVDGAPVEELAALLRGLESNLRGLTLRLNHIGRFPGTDVAFIGVAPTRALIDAHAELHRRLAAIGAGDSSHHYHPGVWVPHCTLSMRLDDPGVSRLLSLAREVRFPMDARIPEVGLVVIPSGDVLERVTLGVT